MLKTAFSAEILAPAGSREQLEAAVKSGADAVYFGATDFNARRNAENFTDEQFLQAVRYCRVRGVKAYITLNTLFTDAETERFLKTAALVAQSGADGVIVQDLGAAALLRKFYPSLPLHASTQTAVHNANGAKLLQSLGFRRIVLARELSLQEIALIRAAVDVELEAFVHGAHCMSFSGLCYTSCMLGGRSANRGLCAQPCRLPFKTDAREYALSLKDMSVVDRLGDLAAAGVCSFKIEGRMKRPEYVAAAVSACRTALAGGRPDLETLKSVFSRGGFTGGYLAGRINGDMFGHRTKEDVTAAAGVLKSLARLYDKEYKRVPVEMRLRVRAGQSAALSVTDGAHTAVVTGETPAPAVTAPLTPERAASYLVKLGDTPYYCSEPKTELEPGLSLSAGAVNALRRSAVEELNALRAAVPPVPDQTAAGLDWVRSLPAAAPPETPALRMRFQTAAQLFTLPQCERCILPLGELLQAPDFIDRLGERLAAELPVLIFPGDEEKNLRQLTALKARGLRFAVAENVGALHMITAAGLTPTGGAHLNLTNRAALGAVEALGCLDNTLSFELNFADIAGLRGAGKTGFLAYGRLPLMRFRACPLRGASGCGDCRGGGFVTDRMNERFPLLCESRRFSTLLNPVPLSTAGLRTPPVDFYTLYFTVEPRERCAEIARLHLAGQRPVQRVTAGMYTKKLL